MTPTSSPAISLWDTSQGERIRIYEAAPGKSRRAFLEQQLLAARPSASKTFYVSCNFDTGGPWAGVGRLFEQIIAAIRAEQPHLAELHAFELVHILPQLRHSLNVLNPTLTDLAPNEEKVRNYAADRAFRIVHGLIDMFDAWKARTDGDPWVIACDDFDQAGVVGNRFFRELIRRRGEKLKLFLVIGTAIGTGETIAASFRSHNVTTIEGVDLADDSVDVLNSTSALERARHLEIQIGDDRLEKQIHLSEMIELWSAANKMDKVIRWKYFGLSFFCNLGFYADALRYGNGLLEEAAKYLPEDDHLRWWIIIKT